MPPVQKQGKSQFNLGATFAAHANDETKYTQDFSNLPAGITGGIAHLVTASLGTFKPGTKLAGQKFLRMAASVVEPLMVHEVVKMWVDDGTKDGKVVVKEARDVRTKGMQTSIVLPLCDTPAKGKQEARSADENIAIAANKVREICGPDCLDGLSDDEADLEARLKTLAETGAYFRFGTRASEPNREYPEHRAFEQWFSNQGLEDYQPGEGGVVVNRNGQSAAHETNGTAASDAGADANDAGEDLDALAASANDDDDADQVASQERLRDIASEKGIDVNDIDGDWVAVVEAINAAGESGEESAADEPVDEAPILKGIYQYQVKDGRTGKPKVDVKTKRPVKPIQVEVTTVNKSKRTCTILSNVDRKTKFSDVGWDELTAV